LKIFLDGVSSKLRAYGFYSYYTMNVEVIIKIISFDLLINLCQF
jgi:hypothetical protein